MGVWFSLKARALDIQKGQKEIKSLVRVRDFRDERYDNGVGLLANGTHYVCR